MEPSKTTPEVDPKRRHLANYEPCEASPSGKNQWRCTICGRVTQGAERECFTIQMMLDLVRGSFCNGCGERPSLAWSQKGYLIHCIGRPNEREGEPLTNCCQTAFLPDFDSALKQWEGMHS